MTERYSRQTSIIDPKLMASLKFLIIGVGAVGRQVALQLVSAGAENIMMFDHDTIEEGNIAAQSWLEKDIGKNKVSVIAEQMRQINSKATIIEKPFFFNSTTWGFEQLTSPWKPDVVMCCVDTIVSRKDIFELLRNDCQLFVDGRMAAEACRIIAISSEKDYYQKTLFETEDGYAGVCTAKSTVYCANIEAGFLVAMTTRWMRQMDNHKTCDFVLNIPAYAIDKMQC